MCAHTYRLNTFQTVALRAKSPLNLSSGGGLLDFELLPCDGAEIVCWNAYASWT